MSLELDTWLDALAEAVQADWRPRNAARDQVLNQSRELIRLCSQAIRAGHREEWESAQAMLSEADAVATEIRTVLEPYPDLFFAGYTQDAFKELVEAHAT